MSDDEIIVNFLKNQPLAVLSTIMPDSLRPESALIGFAETEKLEIIFETFVDTRKWKNLQQNPQISLVAGWDPERHITLQYEGRAVEVPALEAERYIQLFLAKKTPAAEKFLRDPKARLYKVSPTWIRFSDYTQNPPRIIEKDYSQNK